MLDTIASGLKTKHVYYSLDSSLKENVHLFW